MPETENKMSKADGFAFLKRLRDEYTEFYGKVSQAFCSDEVIRECMQMRGYTSDEMFTTLKQVGLTKVNQLSDIELFAPLSSYKTASSWGLLDKNGNFLLAGRYVVPIRDMCGRVTALVGWLPDTRKYVTTPTFGFSKDAQFFNIEQYAEQWNGESVFLAEGIFDTLSLRSLGLFAVGNMGLRLSPVKREILTRFGHVFALPDKDKAGRGVLPYRSTGSLKNKWKLDYNVTFVDIAIEGIKDPDDLIKTYDCKTDLIALDRNKFTDRIKETNE